MIKQKLLVIEEHLKRINAPVLKYLNNGVEKETLEKFFNKIFPELKLPPEIIELYEWHDGTTIDYDLLEGNYTMFSNFSFNSIDQMKKCYDLNIYEFVDKKMIPLFETGEAYLTIDLKEASKVILNL